MRHLAPTSLPPHLVVIDPAVRTPELDCYNWISRHSPLPTTYHLPAMHGLESLAKEPSQIAGLIILGSAASVHDNLPWQRPLEAWVKLQIEKSVPTLGCCYGHQMIAHLFGGKVDYLFPDKKKLLGFREVELLGNSSWAPTQRGPLYVSHCEAVTTLPKNFEVFAQSKAVTIDGMQHRSLPVWTFQPHPEATQIFAEERQSVVANSSEFEFGHRLVERFLHWVQQNALPKR